jgi:hypothetical protein
MPASMCPDAGSTPIYVVTRQANLMAFDPPTGVFSPIGPLRCASAGAPYSMAVYTPSTAYVSYDTGEIFRVRTATAECAPTSFVPRQAGFPLRLAMTFTVSMSGEPQTLYVAGNAAAIPSRAAAVVLGTVDTTTWVLTKVGEMSPEVFDPALSTQGASDLWALFENPNWESAALWGPVWSSGTQQGEGPAGGGLALGSAWAFAWWGGSPYFFTAPQGTTIVTLQGSETGQIAQVGSTAEAVVGAGVAGCVFQPVGP